MVGEPPPVSRLGLDLRQGIVVGARDPVLLDDEPTVVSALFQLRQEPVEVDVPGAELAEGTPTPGLIPCGSPLEDVEPHVLQMHVPEAVTPVAEGRDRIAAGRRQMSSVEEERNVGPLEEALDLARRLHARPHVVVEDRLEATAPRLVDRERDAVEVDLTIARSPVGEDRHRRNLLEQIESRVELAEVPVAEPKLDKRAGELEAVPLEPPAKCRRIAEVTQRPELGSFVPGGSDGVEDVLWARNVRKDADGETERAVAHGGIRDPHGGTSGTRGSFSIVSHAARIQASRGSSEAAIERRSPASAFR